MKKRPLWFAALLGCVFAGALFVSALPPGPPETRRLASEDLGDCVYIRLAELVHDERGSDTLKGNSLFIGPDARVYAARSRGVFAVNLERGTYQYYWLPDEPRGAGIASLYVSRNALWLGLSDGDVACYRFSTNLWRIYAIAPPRSMASGIEYAGGKPIPARAPIRLAQAAGSLLAFEGFAGGQVWYYNESADAFQPYFALPEELAVIPLAPLRRFASSWYMGSDMGLFKLERPGTDNLTWELCGAREGLSSSIVHDSITLESGLLLASSRLQHPRLPRNIRPTSYGYFAYNYPQGRWERIREPRPPKLDYFLGVNAANTNIPSNGLWFYDSGKDIAFQIRGAEGDFYRVLALTPELSLAASMRGLFMVGRYRNEYRALNILEFPELWIDDIAIDGRNLYILSGRGIFIIPKSNFNAEAFARGLDPKQAIAAGGDGKPAESVEPGAETRQEAGGVDINAEDIDEIYALGDDEGYEDGEEPGEAGGAARAASGSSAGTARRPVQDASGYSEEMRFIRQIQQYLRDREAP